MTLQASHLRHFDLAEAYVAHVVTVLTVDLLNINAGKVQLSLPHVEITPRTVWTRFVLEVEVWIPLQ